MDALVEARNLKKYFPISGGQVRAVDDISFSIAEGQTMGLVGESGCGKSTVGRTMLNLVEPSGGQLLYKGTNIFGLPRSDRRVLRKKMGMVFQNPYSALNPRMNVLNQVGEPLKVHNRLRGAALRDRVAELLEQVGLKAEHLNRFPHQFSGGQRQRIVIARSLCLSPKFLILDEPTSALDVSVQAQVLNLIKALQRTRELTYLFITHDLNVVRHIAERVIVMYLGRLVEEGSVDEVFNAPLHPYTEALLSAVPRILPGTGTKRILLEGEVPSPIAPPPGCHFHPRCPKVEAVCRQNEPRLKLIGHRRAACHLV